MRKLENRLKDIRISRKMTQPKLAELLGCSKAQVAKLEDSDRRLSDVWIEKCCHALDCSPNELFGYQDIRVVSDNPNPINRDLLELCGEVLRELEGEGVVSLKENELWEAVIDLYEIAQKIKHENGQVSQVKLAAKWMQKNAQ